MGTGQCSKMLRSGHNNRNKLNFAGENKVDIIMLVC